MSATQDIGADYLAELIKSVSSSPASEAATHENITPPPAQKTTSPIGGADSPPPVADIFSSLLQNPELLAKLPTILSTVRPIIEMMGKSAVSAPSPEIASAPVSATVPASVQPQGATSEKKEPASNDRRAALLYAMKPYLSGDRQQAIDYIIKLSRLGDILKTL